MPRGIRLSIHAGISSMKMMDIENLDKQLLARVHYTTVGDEALWGIPGRSMSKQLNMEYPTELEHVYPPAQWKAFLTSLNHKLMTTSLPQFPMLCCAPVPPVCCLYAYWHTTCSKDRREHLEALIEAENERIMRMGLMWTDPVFTNKSCCGIQRQPELKLGLTLYMNVSQRTQFELDNPQTEQFLANRLLEQAELIEAATAALKSHSSNSVINISTTNLTSDDAAVIPSAMHVDPILDPAQSKLLHRQATIVRRNSLLSRKSASETDHQHVAITTADANARWATPVVPPTTFQSICVTDEPPRETMK